MFLVIFGCSTLLNTDKDINLYLKDIAILCHIDKRITYHTARHYDLPLCLDMNSLQNFVSWQVTI